MTHNVAFPPKIVVPQRPAHLVSRSHLWPLLHLAHQRQLLTLVAPAGYGKTSLLVDWVRSEASLPVCWYTLDRFDADPWTFVPYLVASITQQFPHALAQTTALLTNGAPTSFDTLTATLVREIYAIQDQFILVIDDWHLVDHVPGISELIMQIATHCQQCHLSLASRTHPSLPDFMLLTARQQVSGLDEERLRFTPSEVVAVLAAHFHIEMPLDQAQVLTDQVRGWITGILLSVQAHGIPRSPSPLSSSDGERQVYLFLTEQVFDRQPQKIQKFLRDTALLDELTAERCDAIFQRHDSGLLLDQLQRQHLFITEVRPGVLRYHPLFREFLLEKSRRIHRDQFHTSALQVAEAYAAQHQWSQAFDTCLLAHDIHAAQEIAMRGGNELYTSGRLETLEYWFSALPLDRLNASLLCLKARVLLDRGQTHAAQVLVDLARSRMQPGEVVTVLLVHAQIARVVGRYQEAIEAAQQALAHAQSTDTRSAALRLLGICHHRIGNSAQAIDLLNEALRLEQQGNNLYIIGHLQHDLGVCYEQAGMLSMAESHYTQATACWSELGNKALRALSQNSLGVVQHLAGHYRIAYQTLTTALTEATEAAVPDYQVTILTSLGDLYSDLQLWEAATITYEAARQNGGGSAFIVSYLDLATIRLLVRQRQYHAAARRMEMLPEEIINRQATTALLLRGEIAWGMGVYSEALRIASEVIESLHDTQSVELIQAYLLQAQATMRTRSSDRTACITSLMQACTLAGQLNMLAMLDIETLHRPSLIRWAVQAQYPPATSWTQHHIEIRQIAQTLIRGDQRSSLIVRTLGVDQIILNNQHVQLGWHQARELFYYLLAHPTGVTGDELAEAIWPQSTPKASRETLKMAIYRLRSALCPQLIELHQRKIYQINREVVRLDYDVERFLLIIDKQADDIEALLEAIELYTGPYLPLTDLPWATNQRTLLEQRYQHALRLAAFHCEKEALFSDALTLYKCMIALDGFDEAAHAGMMRCFIALGNRAAAIAQYQALRRTLNEELGLYPEATSEVEQLYARILQGS